MSARTVLYVYVVGRDDQLLERAPSLVAGVDGHELRQVTSGGLTAVVSPVAADRFGEEYLAAELEDLEKLESMARAHHAVVDTAFAEATVLPMRLATVYRNEARVAAMLDKEHAYFAQLLDRLEGHVELGVKVYVTPRSAPAEQAPAKTTGSPGRAYLQRRRTERRAAQDSYRAASGVAQAAASTAASLAAARAVHRPQGGEWSAGRGENIANEAYLVALRDVERFGAALSELTHDTPGVEVEVTGPWAPYSFATGALTDETAEEASDEHAAHH